MKHHKLNPWFTERSAKDAADAWRAAQVWIIPFSVLAFLWVIMLLYKRRAPDAARDAHAKNKKPRGYSRMRQTSSRLDTEGSLLSSWQVSNTIKHSAPSGQGWYNLCVILGVTWVFSHTVYSMDDVLGLLKQTGFMEEIWNDVLARAGDVGVSFVALIAAYFVSTYALELLILKGILRGRAEYITQTVVELCMFFVPVFFLRFRPEWSVFQRLGFGMEAAVLTMKMHSYIVSNRHLRLDRETGGFGVCTGAYLESASESPSSDSEASPPPSESSPTDKQEDQNLDAHAVAKHSSKSSLDSVTESLIHDWQHKGLRHRFSKTVAIPTRPRGDTTTGDSDVPTDVAELSKQINSSVESVIAAPVRIAAPDKLLAQPDVNTAGKDDTKGKPTNGIVAYPQNVTLYDFFMYSLSPTLVYEPNFPKSVGIRPGYLLEKLFLAAGLGLGCKFMIEKYFAPVLSNVHNVDVYDAILQLLLPTTFAMLISFFIVFECCLNFFAELTRFGDREYYLDWWNSTTFAEFSRKWNKPVHEFLLRHVYIDSMHSWGITQGKAIYVTFLVSIIAHEAVIWAALTPSYPPPILAIMSFFQFPLMTLLRLPFIKGKAFGNLVFWSFLQFGVSMTIVLYARHYQAEILEV